MPNDFVIQNVTQTLTGSLNTFTSVTFLDDTTVTNYVDTVLFDSTVANRVTLSTPQTITGTWSIGNVTAFDDVIVHGLVNTFNLSTDVVLTYGDQDVRGYKNFSLDVDVLGDMYTDYYGNISYLNPVYYAAHAVREDVPTNISGYTYFTSSGLTFTGNITVTGYVLGVDLSEMLSNFGSNMERIESDLIQEPPE
ncbi:uncharacterized protein [Antedon mediterranea]|uniref:uncharacterized protein n=1 Tax=Antedon mediterranea TaxID=105859 RepID=UPI003AF9F788